MIEANKQIFRNKNNKKRLIYNKETYNSLPLIEKIFIKNKVDRIIKAYKLFILKKSVRNTIIIFYILARFKNK